MVFELHRADGSTRSVKGYRSAAPGAGEKRYGSARFQEKDLPPRVDLRRHMTDVENQGATSSCVANAVAGAYEYLLKRHLADDAYDVSRLFLYYNAREMEAKDEMVDDGTFIANAVKSLKEYGLCSEDTWPFEEASVNEAPSDEAYEEGAKFLVEEYAVVPTELHAWKHCLAEGYPIVFGLTLFNSFDKHRKPGLVPLPTTKETSREDHSGHAMLCVGYSDKDQVFIVRNSWGDEWGDDGYCYIPYRYIMNPDFNFGDSWHLRRLDEIALEEELWGDDESILPDIESELGEMSDEDYQDMLDDMGDYPPEYRIGLILLHAASADGEASDEELEGIATYMEETLRQLGVELSANKILKFCRRSLGDQELLTDSIHLLGEHFSKELLAAIVRDAQAIVGVDDLAEEERAFLDRLVRAWQVQEELEAADEEDDDEGEDEDEEEEDDEDE